MLFMLSNLALANLDITVWEEKLLIDFLINFTHSRILT